MEIQDIMQEAVEGITILKRNLAGEVTWRYEGRVIERKPNYVLLEAFFNRDDTQVMDAVLKRNDRFVETFYTDRWYNIFAIFDRDDRLFKGWYCNIGYPAVVRDETVSYVDLALDLWVTAEGAQTVLDEDEFLALPLDDQTRTQATAAMEELTHFIMTKQPPR